jgi:DNA-binding transcriptional ArsR family regulator
MVKQLAMLDDTFLALADGTRRAIVARLSDGEARAVSDLAAPFAMSLPAVLKHVNVLSEAGLLVREKRGRTVYCRLEPAPMREARAWLERYEKFWSERLDALAAYVEEDRPCPPDRSRISSSGAISERRSRRSSRPGRKGKR